MHIVLSSTGYHIHFFVMGDYRRRSSLPAIKDQELAAITTDIDGVKAELEELERKQRRRMAALQKAEEEQRQREVAEREEQVERERQARQEQEKLVFIY
ncbi:unnamed protein product [Dibothriocephalus latus]|uniref:Uncharacterized protein n=1 Tax=Dibothriocephalus latus TaxID=60516 RepID=A0A3P7LDQ8_DIBLA|nr:unnamed protein product [Dibothriocephalus latus]